MTLRGIKIPTHWEHCVYGLQDHGMIMRYIGQTWNLRGRISQHLSRASHAGQYTRHGNRYGEYRSLEFCRMLIDRKFKVVLLMDWLKEREAIEHEAKFIRAFGQLINGTGTLYNIYNSIQTGLYKLPWTKPILKYIEKIPWAKPALAIQPKSKYNLGENLRTARYKLRWTRPVIRDLGRPGSILHLMWQNEY